MSAAKLDMKCLPEHIAIIMDGNGRWAKKRHLPRVAGHEAGARSVRQVVEACRELGGVKALSLYAFSTENWRRSKTEVSALFRLLSKYIKKETENLHRENIRVTMMGRIDELPKRARDDLQWAMDRTSNNTAMTLNLAINYGSHQEIADAAKAIARQVQEGVLSPDDIDECAIADHLYRPELPELDLLIRTSGEMRVSNFMLWQLSYAEFVCVDTLWPDFGKEDIHAAIAEFQHRDRRYGGRRNGRHK